MSRTVDMSNPGSWSDEDIVYLRDRNLLPDDYDLPDNLQSPEPESRSLEDVPNIGDVGTIADNPPTPPGTTASFVDDEDNLDEMTRAQLQREADVRGLDTSGTKAELIERIRANEAGSE